MAGLEEAVEKGNNELIEKAVRRINMLRAIQVSIGGIPLLYGGDEFGQMNDYTYVTDPTKINDSRWTPVDLKFMVLGGMSSTYLDDEVVSIKDGLLVEDYRAVWLDLSGNG